MSENTKGAAAPQVVADEPMEVPREHTMHEDCNCEAVGYAKGWNAHRAAAPVQAQEPVTAKPVGRVWKCREDHFLYAKLDDGIAASGAVKLGDILYATAPVQPVAVPDATIVLSGHQLRMALDLINPGGPDERDELDDQLSFGIRQHRDDDGKVSTDMCCWNGDTDGVLPLDGEYETAAALAAQGDAKDAELRKLYTSPLIAAAWDRRVGSCNASKTIFESDKSHFVSGWNCAIDAAIAAKAAS